MMTLENAAKIVKYVKLMKLDKEQTDRYYSLFYDFFNFMCEDTE